MHSFVYISFVVGVVVFLLTSRLLIEEKWSNPTPLDIVYTWVDGSDELFLKEKNMWSSDVKSRDAISNSRYDDNQELKYSLRSLDLYFPQFRNVYIVTRDKQIPSFINRNHPRLKIIHHSSIMPKTSLPTFNSVSIESCLHLIPGLSENYLYFNDDVILMRHLSRSYFFDSNNTPVTYIDKKDFSKEIPPVVPEYTFESMVSWNLALLKQLFDIDEQGVNHHVPVACRKSWDSEILSRIHPELVNHTIHSKFRKTDNIALTSVIRPLYYECKKHSPNKKPMNAFLDFRKGSVEEFEKVLNEVCSSTEIDVMCMNSYPEIDEKQSGKIFYNLMESRFPHKSRFEL